MTGIAKGSPFIDAIKTCEVESKKLPQAGSIAGLTCILQKRSTNVSTL